MKLTRRQFDVLEKLAISGSSMTQRELEKATGYSLGSINRSIQELIEQGFISEGIITDAGLEALEPYRCKRAIFVAAGFGSRLVPITLNTPKPLVRVHGVRIIDHLIDACLNAGINDIYIVRGYLGEQFDQLLYKYPMIKFIENPLYNEANNISSALMVKNLLSNAYVLESDLLLSNPGIIRKYHYKSNYLGIKKLRTDDWCAVVRNGVIIEEKVGGEGDDIWQMIGISYWDETDGMNLKTDLQEVFNSPGGKERYWEQVALVYKKEHYQVEIRECFDEDVLEIDTFNELKAIDSSYNV